MNSTKARSAVRQHKDTASGIEDPLAIFFEESDSKPSSRMGTKGATAAHILVVDDEPAIRSTLAFVLRMNGYQVTQAGDGEEALRLILENQGSARPYDLLLTDIRMPRMSGKDLIRELKKREISMPILVVSAGRDSDFIDELLKGGGAGYLPKPYDLAEVGPLVQSLLEKKEAEPLCDSYGYKTRRQGLNTHAHTSRHETAMK